MILTLGICMFMFRCKFPHSIRDYEDANSK